MTSLSLLISNSKGRLWLACFILILGFAYCARQGRHADNILPVSGVGQASVPPPLLPSSEGGLKSPLLRIGEILNSGAEESLVISQAAKFIGDFYLSEGASKEFAQFLNNIPSSRLKNLVLQSLAAECLSSLTWSDQNRLDWIDLTSLIKSREERDFATTGIEFGQAISRCSTELLTQHISSTSDPRTRRLLYRALGMNLGRNGKDESLAHTVGLNNADKAAFIDGWLIELGENSNGSEALKLFRSICSYNLIDTGAVAPNLIRPILKSYGGEVFSIVEGLDMRQQGKNKMKSDFMEQWIAIDPLSSSQWIDGLGASTSKDAYIEQLVNHLAELKDKDIEAIQRWIDSVSSEKLRSKMRGTFGAKLQNAPTG